MKFEEVLPLIKNEEKAFRLYLNGKGMYMQMDKGRNYEFS
ncbi:MULTISPECIES: DUF2829 domain-containing protein [unclassified Clostridioides]